jgi:hypothetical protein
MLFLLTILSISVYESIIYSSVLDYELVFHFTFRLLELILKAKLFGFLFANEFLILCLTDYY